MRKSLLLKILLLVLIFGVSGCFFGNENPCDPGSPDFRLSTIEGTVNSKITQVTLENATIELKLAGVEIESGETDKEGRFTFSNIEPCRTYTLIAARGDYKQESRDITTESGIISGVSFELVDAKTPDINHILIPSINFQTEVTIIPTITDNERISKAKLFYKTSGDSSFTESDLVKTTETSYTGIIPSDSVLMTGVEYYIYAEDVSGNIKTSGSKDEPHRIIVQDVTPPTITYLLPVTTGLLNTTATISPTVTDDVGVVSVDLFYRTKATIDYLEVRMVEEGDNTYNGVIPGEAVVEAGVEYYIRAKDNAGNTSTWPEDASVNPNLMNPGAKSATVVASPTSISGNGASTSSITVSEVKDAEGNVIDIGIYSVQSTLGNLSSPTVSISGNTGSVMLTSTKKVGTAEVKVKDGTVVIGTATVEFTNLPPIASAGPGQIVSGEVEVTLDGSGSSDPDGDSLTYSWSQTSGPPVTLSNLAVVSPTFTLPSGLAQIVLTFLLTVDDGKDATDSDSVNIITLDKIPPDTFIDDPIDGKVVPKQNYTVKGRASDESGINRVEVSPDAGATWATASGTISWSYEWELSQEVGTSATLKARSIDNAGNTDPTPASTTVNFN